jgi:hypothetical protein
MRVKAALPRPFYDLVHLDDGHLTEQRGAAADPSLLDKPVFEKLLCDNSVPYPLLYYAHRNKNKTSRTGQAVPAIIPKKI